MGLQRVGWFVLGQSIVVVEDVAEVKVSGLLATHGLQTLINFDHHVVGRLLAQHHHNKFDNVVYQKVYVSVGDLLVLLLLEPPHSVLDDIALGGHKISNFVNCFYIQQLGLRHHFKITDYNIGYFKESIKIYVQPIQ